MNYTTLTLRLARGAAALLMLWLVLSGVLLAVRGSAGASRPLASGWLLMLVLGLVAAAPGMRRFWSAGRASLPTSSLIRAYPLILTSTGLALWGWSLTRGGFSASAAVAFWLTLVCEEGWAWRREFILRRQEPSLALAAAGGLAGNVLLQQFTRLRTSEGEEIIRGSLAMTIESGNRAAAGHVAFCPPFAERPHFEMRPNSAKDVTLKLSQLYPHGARIEAKRGQPAKIETTFSVQFVARARR
jgi:hypothetical protein